MPPSYPLSLLLVTEADAFLDRSVPDLEFQQALQSSGIFSAVGLVRLGRPESWRAAADVLPAGDLVVVPWVTSGDRAMRDQWLSEGAGWLSGPDYRVRFTPPVGTSVRMGELLLSRMVEAFLEFRLPPEETTVVLLGEGDEWNPDRGLSVYGLAGLLRTAVEGVDIQVAFTGQRPLLDQLLQQRRRRFQLILPFVTGLSERGNDRLRQAGWQRAEGPTGPCWRVPTEAGLAICDRPLGLYPELANACLELATDSDQLRNVA